MIDKMVIGEIPGQKPCLKKVVTGNISEIQRTTSDSHEFSAEDSTTSLKGFDKLTKVDENASSSGNCPILRRAKLSKSVRKKQRNKSGGSSSRKL